MNNRGTGARTDHAGEALPFPVVPLKRQTAKVHQVARHCRECGSPLSDANQFCWMCGASRDSENDPRVDPVSTKLAFAEHYAHFSSASDQRTPKEPPLETRVTGLQSELVDLSASGEPTPAEHVATESEAFDSTRHPQPEASKPERPKRAFWRTAIVVALLVVIACLAYSQRDHAKALLGIASAEAAQH